MPIDIKRRLSQKSTKYLFVELQTFVEVKIVLYVPKSANHTRSQTSVYCRRDSIAAGFLSDTRNFRQNVAYDSNVLTSAELMAIVKVAASSAESKYAQSTAPSRTISLTAVTAEATRLLR